jgi:hypothetical protein
MATEKKTLNIECKLNKENYQLWEFQMVALLEDEKLLEAVSNDDLGGQSPYQVKNNARAKRAILTKTNIKSAPEMWQYLYNSFSGINMARKYAGIKKLATLTYGIGSMEENLLALERTLTSTITAAEGETIKIEDLAVAMFLNCLPERFASVRSVLEQQDKLLTLSTIRNVLITEEERQSARENSEGFAALTRSQIRKCLHARDPKRCWTCDRQNIPARISALTVNN